MLRIILPKSESESSEPESLARALKQADSEPPSPPASVGVGALPRLQLAVYVGGSESAPPARRRAALLELGGAACHPPPGPPGDVCH